MAVSTQDLIKGIDLSGSGLVTGTQLDQLVDLGTPYSDKGIIMVTADVAGVADVPDASVTTKWTRYFWLRQGATSVTAYVWNPAAVSDFTYLKWHANVVF